MTSSTNLTAADLEVEELFESPLALIVLEHLQQRPAGHHHLRVVVAEAERGERVAADVDRAHGLLGDGGRVAHAAAAAVHLAARFTRCAKLHKRRS